VKSDRAPRQCAELYFSLNGRGNGVAVPQRLRTAAEFHFFRCSLIIIRINRTDWCSDNTVGLYSWGVRSSEILRFIIAFLSPSMKIPGYNLEQATTASFHNLPTSSLMLISESIPYSLYTTSVNNQHKSFAFALITFFLYPLFLPLLLCFYFYLFVFLSLIPSSISLDGRIICRSTEKNLYHRQENIIHYSDWLWSWRTEESGFDSP
jgi:hypothetical protein